VCDRKRRVALASLIIALALSFQSVHGQQLTVQTDSGKQVLLTRGDIEALPHTQVTAGPEQTAFEGVALKGVLEKAGIVFGESLKGKRLASCLVVQAVDGYRVVIALPELYPAFTGKQVLLVFLRNGKPLDEKEGPYRIVIPDEKRMARWVKQLATLKIVEVE
jgi:hypothetical protein